MIAAVGLLTYAVLLVTAAPVLALSSAPGRWAPAGPPPPPASGG